MPVTGLEHMTTVLIAKPLPHLIEKRYYNHNVLKLLQGMMVFLWDCFLEGGG